MKRAVRLLAHLVLPVVAMLTVASSARAQGIGGPGPWKVRGRVTATACAGTHCGTRLDLVRRLVTDQIGDVNLLGLLCDCPNLPCTSGVRPATLECTGCTYTCPTGGVCLGESPIVDPATFGAYEPSRVGARFNLTDRGALRDVLRACFQNTTLGVTGFRAVVRSEPGSETFEEHVRISFSMQVRKQPVVVTARGVFHGTQVLTSVTRTRRPQRRLPVDELVRSVLAPP